MKENMNCPNCSYAFSKNQKIKVIFDNEMKIYCPLCRKWFVYNKFRENIICDSPEVKNRPSGITYKNSKLKETQRKKQLEKLIYSNFNLTNKELAKKIGISEKEFYRSEFNLIKKELKKIYKQQSLFWKLTFLI